MLTVVAGVFGSRLVAHAQRPGARASPWSVGLGVETNRTGTAAGPLLAYRLTDFVEVDAQVLLGELSFPQIGCLAYDADTVALLRASYLYFGDDRREANLIVRQEAEVSTGVSLLLGGTARLELALRGGLRRLRVESQVDEVLTDAVARRQRYYGCGEFYVGRVRPSGPRDLDSSQVFHSRATVAFADVNVGGRIRVTRGVHAFVRFSTRWHYYGGTRFRARDPRAAQSSSIVLPLRGHAPRGEYRARLGLLVGFDELRSLSRERRPRR